jgi:hypothetical protein
MLSMLVVLLVATPALAAPRFEKGPYLMDAEPTSIAVMFELSEPSAATVIVRSADGAEKRVEQPELPFHEVVIEGLVPETAYDYRVELPGRAGATGSFVTAPEPGEGPIEFLVMGDNRTDATAHAAVVRAMEDVPADFMLNTGDMVARGSDPDDWAEMFEVQSPLLASLPLFPTLGNHELAETGAGLAAFLQYTRVPRDLGGGETYYGFTYGPVRFFVVDSNEPWAEDSEQREWLETQLAMAAVDPDIEHIMLAMHHGPFSSGRHGGHRGMIESGFVELLSEHGVALVFAGHDHMYERGELDDVKYIVTGGGGAPIYPVNRRGEGQLAFEPAYHFLRVAVDGPRVTVTAVRPDGSEIERCGFTGEDDWVCADALSDDPAAGPVHPGANPTTFWIAHQAKKPIVWAVLALLAVAIVAIVAMRRRSKRARPTESRAEVREGRTRS